MISLKHVSKLDLSLGVFHHQSGEKGGPAGSRALKLKHVGSKKSRAVGGHKRARIISPPEFPWVP